MTTDTTRKWLHICDNKMRKVTTQIMSSTISQIRERCLFAQIRKLLHHSRSVMSVTPFRAFFIDTYCVKKYFKMVHRHFFSQNTLDLQTVKVIWIHLEKLYVFPNF